MDAFGDYGNRACGYKTSQRDMDLLPYVDGPLAITNVVLEGNA